MSATAEPAASHPPGPARVAIYLASIAVAYSLLPITSGMSVAFSVVDVVSVLVFWGVVGAGQGLLMQRSRKTAWLRERPIYAWTIVTAGWALAEAMFTAVVVVKPTRWPPLPYTAIGMGLPMIAAGALGLWALRRASREQRIAASTPRS